MKAIYALKCLIYIVSLLVGINQWTPAAMSSEIHNTHPRIRITVVYNNMAHTPGLTPAWGFAAVIEDGTDVVLFDTGGDGPTLLDNIERLEIAPDSVDAIVLSHIHGDHTGGLDAFLSRRSDVTVYMPRSFPAAFRHSVEQRGAHIEVVSAPRHLLANMYSTGEMGHGTNEQALIVDTASGLVVITGCAHPGIVNVTRAASRYLGKEVYLLMGGFHLIGSPPQRNRETIAMLRQLGVRKVAPTHCTGDDAIALFREKWADDFIESGCGAVIEVP